MRTRYVIGSGWWCADGARAGAMGDERIRGAEFHHQWYRALDRFTQPEKIVIVDSASPIKPAMGDDPRLEFISLTDNSGHSTQLKGARFCGWTRGVAAGLGYAIATETDYFVYVEQDVLLHGAGIIEACIAAMRTPYMFGDPRGTPQLLQQSFFIIAKRGMAPFLSRLLAIPQADNQIGPETKFHIAASGVLSALPKAPLAWSHGVTRRLLRPFRAYDFLPVGYGRTRPIDFGTPQFYFQHGSAAELAAYERL